MFNISIYAQDVIFKKNGDEIKAKVEEIGSTDIKYKKFENLNGPSYTIAKSEVFIVKYENGTKDIINQIDNTSTEKQKQPSNNDDNDYKHSYFKIGGGYGLSLTPSDPTYQETYSNKISYKSKSEPYGNGINFGLAYDMFFSKYMGMEIGVSCLYGDKTKLTNSYAYGSTSDKLSSSIITKQGEMLCLKPSIILTPGFKKVNPYMTFGLIGGLGRGIEKETDRFFNNSGGAGDVYYFESVYKGGFVLGTASSLGMNISLGKSISCYFELRDISANYIPLHNILIRCTYNGADWLNNFSKHDKQTDYVGTYSNTDNNNSANPTKSNRISLPCNSFGANAGITFSF